MGLSVRSESEQDAYMAGQLAALKLARERGVDYAEKIVAAAQEGIRKGRPFVTTPERKARRHRELTPPKPPVGADGEHTPRGQSIR
jgi:hypothetical protein